MAKIARRKVAAYVANQLQSGVSPFELARQTVAYLVEEKQTHQLELLIRDIEVALEENYGSVAVRVSSARKLDDNTKDAITLFVQGAQNAKSAGIIEEQTDPDIIGGVIIRTPSRIFDSSVRNQLRQLALSTKE